MKERAVGTVDDRSTDAPGPADAGPAPDRAGSPSSPWTWWPGVAGGAFVALIAFVWSWHPSLWSDEAATISAASRSLPQLWSMLGTIDLVHGFYYLLMHGWMDLFGSTAMAIRGFSVLAIGIAGACVFWLAERFRGRVFAGWAVAVFALLPRVAWAGMEARPYALTAMFAVAATLVLVVALDRPDRRAAGWWVAYGLLLVGGVLSNLYVGLLVAAHLVGIVWDRQVTRRQRVGWLISAGAAVLAVSPFVLGAYRQAGQLSDRAFGARELGQNIAVNQFFLGDTPTTTTGSARTALHLGDIGSWWLPAGLVLAAGGWGLMILAVVAHRGELAGKTVAGGRPLLVWLLPWIAVPPVVIGLYSLVVSPMYGPRYLTFATPAVALLVAYGLTAISRRGWRAAVAGLLVLAVLPVYVSQRQPYAKNGSDWISVAGFVAANARPGEGVYFAPRYDVDGPTVGQTTRGISVAYPDAFDGLVDLTLLRSPAEADNLVGESRYLEQSTAALADVDTVWVIRRVDYPADRAAADDAQLAAAGFDRSLLWGGPLDDVIRYDRLPAG